MVGAAVGKIHVQLISNPPSVWPTSVINLKVIALLVEVIVVGILLLQKTPKLGLFTEGPSKTSK